MRSLKFYFIYRYTFVRLAYFIRFRDDMLDVNLLVIR
jgi:hypothetical protein